jgi:3-hydroxyacyl-CoA dehydrogenase
MDVVLDIESHYAESRTGVPTGPRDYLQKIIQDGHLGVKNGRGSYEYNGNE